MTSPDTIRQDETSLRQELATAGVVQWKGRACRCPFCDDKTPSAGIYQHEGVWRFKCHKCSYHGDVFDIRAKITGKSLVEVLKAASDNGHPTPKTPPRIIAAYDYRDEEGALLYQALRLEPKTFRQRRPDPDEPGKWLWNLNGTRRVLYRLPELLNEREERPDDWRFIVEGEKDVDNLRAAGLIATCNVGGAGKWHADYNAPLAGHKVCVIADKDDAGRKHAAAVAKATGGRVIELPGDKVKDASDFLSAGGTAAEIIALAERPSPAPSHDLIFDPRDPLPIAREYVRLHHCPESPALWHINGNFHRWTGSHYPAVADDEIRASIYKFVEPASRMVKDELVPFQPTRAKVDNILDALRAECHLSTTPPAWIIGTGPDPAECVAAANGILHLPTLTLHKPSPRLFNLNAVAFDYNPSAPPPVRWLAFLDSIWSGDVQAKDTLQEMFGLLLTLDTRFEKLFLIVGPKRSGKGTIARVLRALIGGDNTCGPTLASLSQNFGLQSLIGKQAAIIADARLGGQADQAAIAERLLSISGEDAMSIPRKNKTDWEGKLSVRFVILSNELPRIADASGALASRFVVLMLRESFINREDLSLTESLLGELPSILNWAIAGLQRLQARGRFVQPDSSAHAIAELEALGSPVGAFVKDRCRTEAGAFIECSKLYQAWVEWCKTEGRDHPGTAATFGRDILSAVPGMQKRRYREYNRTYFYEGIDLHEQEYGNL